MKRIRDPCFEYESLVAQFTRRFPELRDLLASDSSLRVLLSYLDPQGEVVHVENTSDLIQVYKCAEKEYEDRAMRFYI